MVGIPNKTVPYLQTASQRVYSPHNQTSPYRWEAGKAPTCVHPLQGAGSKQGNLGRPPCIDVGEQRENVTQQLVSAKTNWLRRPFHNLWINRGGKPQTHSLEALAKENVYTHVHNFIHRHIHSPVDNAAQNHTCQETLIDILRAGCLGIVRVVCGAVWHVAGVARCVGASVRHSNTIPDPHPHTGSRSATGERRRNVSGAVCRLRCGVVVPAWCVVGGNGESRPGGWPALDLCACGGAVGVLG